MSSHHYRHILKTSTITGISRVVGVFAGFVRTKVIAMYTGPAGIGLIGLYSSATNVISTVSSLGLGSSAIRSIAVSASDPESQKVSETIIALRRLSWLTGLAGTIACAVLSPWISMWTFGSERHALAIALLSLTVLLGQLTASQNALLRGLRQVRQLADGSIFSAFASVAMAAAWIIPLGTAGIVPFILTLSVVNLISTWWFVRRVKVKLVDVTWAESLRHGQSMLSLGLTFLLSTGLSAGASYLIGVILFHSGDTHLNGLYQAAWSCSGALVGFVLASMGQDFYPRLAAATDDPEAVRVIINSQIEVGVLLALPGLVAMAGLADWIFPILYSREFGSAAEALPWFVMGSFGRILSWPMGYYLIAAGEMRRFVITEFAVNAFHVSAVYFLTHKYGIVGAGAAFCGLYIVYTPGMALLLGRIVRFKVSPVAIRYSICGYLAIATASFAGIIGASVVSVVTAWICLRSLVRKMGPESTFSRRITALPAVGRFLA